MNQPKRKRTSLPAQPRQSVRERQRGMRRLMPWQRVTRLLLLFVAVAASITYLDRVGGAFSVVESRTVAMRMSSWKGSNTEATEKAKQRVVMVPISDETFRDPAFSDLGGPPLPRSAHAKVVQELHAAGAQVIAFDMLFDVPREGDHELAAAARKHGRVAWGAYWDEDDQRMLLPNDRLLGASKYVGHTRVPHAAQDTDPLTDRIEPVIIAGGAQYPALSVEAVRLLNVLGDKPISRSGRQWKIGNWVVPTGEDNTFRLSFFGKQNNEVDSDVTHEGEVEEVFPSGMPYERVYHGMARNPMFSSGFFRGKIALIGDISTLSNDFSRTPVGRLPGLEIHTHATATLLQQSVVRDVPSGVAPLLMAGLMALTCLPVIGLRWLNAAAGVLVLLVAYYLVATRVFTDTGVLLPLVMPLVAGIAMAAAAGIERGWTEESERTRLKSVIGQYVSEQVSDTGAPTGEVALVFTDIENSSAMTQQFGQRFEAARDQHFEILRRELLAWNGFEVETAGDSLFAVFARPSDAVQFATHTQQSMQNHVWPWDIGSVRVRIGIHFGEPFVGRDRTRLTYRGHHTNLAARVSASATGGQTLVSNALREATEQELQARYAFRPAGVFSLKGVGDETLYEVQARDTAVAANSASVQSPVVQAPILNSAAEEAPVAEQTVWTEPFDSSVNGRADSGGAAELTPGSLEAETARS